MSFPRYPEYKDSGVEWLGAVPEHWGIRRVRWLCEIKKRIAGELGYDVLSITQQGVRVKDLDSNDGQLSMDYSKYQFVEVGDFAMNHMDLLTGYVDLSPVHGVTSPDYRVFTIRDPAICHDQYLLYLFQMGYKNRIFFAYGQGSSQLGRWRLPTEQFRDLPFPLPPKSEQQNITAFLDRETVKIDALVAEQRRLMELLKEKRQAVISHTVTQGLNPRAPMKPSGIEWLGDVPAHWEVKKIKHLLSRDGYKAGPFGSNLITSELSDEGDILVLTPEHVANESFDLPFNQYLKEARREEMSAFFVDLNDIVFPIVGTLGRAMIVSVPRPGILNQRLARMSADTSKLLPAYLKLILTDVDFYKKLDEIESKGAILNHITKEKLINRPILLPPMKEQKEILSFLDAETAKFDTLTAEAQRAIDLLQERRTALISAAVTGQIDVRQLSQTQKVGAGGTAIRSG